MIPQTLNDDLKKPKKVVNFSSINLSSFIETIEIINVYNTGRY